MSQRDLAVAGAILLTVGALLVTCSPGKVQSKEYDWLSEACCDLSDCRPISASEITKEGDTWVWRSARSGAEHRINERATLNYKKGQPGEDLGSKIRTSKDGRYWGCERATGGPYNDAPGWVAYCIFLPELY